MFAFHPIATEQRTRFFVGFVPTADMPITLDYAASKCIEHAVAGKLDDDAYGPQRSWATRHAGEEGCQLRWLGEIEGQLQ